MGKRNAAAAIVDADRLPQFETPPKRAKHATAAATMVVGPVTQQVAAAVPAAAAPPATPAAPYSPNVSASEFTLSKEFVDGTLLMDLALKQWRIGKPIGKGSFGEIFLASDDIEQPVTSETAEYVVKIEPHSNGPLFVEIHCLLNTAKRSESCQIPPGMPEYIASGSHMFKNQRYRFLILKRYRRDLHSIIKNKRVDPKSIPVIACQILDVLEHLHDQGYVHSDIKAENLMIGTVVGSRSKATANGDHHHRANDFARTAGESGAGLQNGGGSLYHHHVPQDDHHIAAMCGGRSRTLRPLKTVTYRDLSDDEDRTNGARSAARRGGRGRRRKNPDASFTYSISPRRTANGYEELKAATEEAHWNEMYHHKQQSRAAAAAAAAGHSQAAAPAPPLPLSSPPPAHDRIHLIDFGLASKFMNSGGQHRPFCMDQRRAHDGTLEFTSRDAHMGAHVRRSDLECLGYNLVYWSRGFLPWKDEKLLNQPEQVHRMKEYFMTDVREMLRLIYGEDCPAYLGEFLAYVNQLTYDARPDYQHCRALFVKEVKRLGGTVPARHQPLRLDLEAIERGSVPLTAQDEAEITNKINHVKSLMKLGGALFPYRESTPHSKATSKNLRSKRSDVRNLLLVGGGMTPGGGTGAAVAAGGLVNGGAHTQSATPIGTRKRVEKKFSCEEIFATDADQIARDRVEKEFERAEQMQDETVRRYKGKPTYAIQEQEERKHRTGHSVGALEYAESEDYIKGYTKPMMDILRKRQSQLFHDIEEERRRKSAESEEVATAQMNGQDEDGEEGEENDIEDDASEDDDAEEEENESVEAEEVDDEEVEEPDEEECYDEYHPSKGSSHRKGQKKEDTDSDFINDGGCEEEEDEQENDDPDDSEEDDGEEEEQDSDFNDQESTYESDEEEEMIMPSRRKGMAKNGNKGGHKPNAGSRKRVIVEHPDPEPSVAVSIDRDRKRSKHANGRSRNLQSYHNNFRVTDGTDRADPENATRYGATGSGDRRRDKNKSRKVHRTVTEDQHHHNNNNGSNNKVYYDGDVDDSSHDTTPANSASQADHSGKYQYMKRRKSGLRERIRPTDRGNDYQDNLQRKRKAAMRNKKRRESAALSASGGRLAATAEDDHCLDESGVDDDTSRSSHHSVESSSSMASGTTSSSSAASTSSSSSSAASTVSTASSASSFSSSSVSHRRGRRTANASRGSSSHRSSVRRRGKSEAATSLGSSSNGGGGRNGWSRSNSQHSNRSATNSSSRSSSVSASTIQQQQQQQDDHHHWHGGGRETDHQQQQARKRLATLPEDDFLGEEDDDTRDVDYSPICTRGKRKTKAGTAHNGSGREHKSTIANVRRRNESKGGGRGGHSKGTTDASSTSSVVSSSSSSATGRHRQAPHESRRSGTVPQQQHRGRRYQQHHQPQPHYYSNPQDAGQPQRHSTTMLVRTYSRG
ncbi:uncharacterized protein LOC128269353 [Anopheles cruzii]|uniref:uncharacterized protein LOC128269353 n=1 Tax=Anopheles cruzii TaxID=68878 RepID=UPI0022EC3A26|nr:uncharacterized protein LOC128269353 [Anopheles cruzii]